MARNYIEGLESNDAGAREIYKTITASQSGSKNLLDVSTASIALATRVDEASASVTYVGKADIATTSSTAAWQISKITISGTQTIITWADGDSAFDNIWDNRASLSYS